VLDLIISRILLTLSRGEFSTKWNTKYCLLRLGFFSRHMEDFVTWVDTSKLKRTVMRYNDEVCLFKYLMFPVLMPS
jgi:hypothetical protein